MCAGLKSALLAASQPTLATTLPTLQCPQSWHTSLSGRDNSGFVPNAVHTHRKPTGDHESHAFCTCQCSLPVPKRSTVLHPHPIFPPKYEGHHHWELLNRRKFGLNRQLTSSQTGNPAHTHTLTHKHTHAVCTYKQNQRNHLCPSHKKPWQTISFSCVRMLGFLVGKGR